MHVSEEQLAAARRRVWEQARRVRAARVEGGDVALAWRVLRHLRESYAVSLQTWRARFSRE